VVRCGQRYMNIRDTLSTYADISRKISSMLTHNALTDAKMVGSKRDKLETRATA
jgi:hypothetical protein